jgi:hypothetical protein
VDPFSLEPVWIGIKADKYGGLPKCLGEVDHSCSFTFLDIVSMHVLIYFYNNRDDTMRGIQYKIGSLPCALSTIHWFIVEDKLVALSLQPFFYFILFFHDDLLPNGLTWSTQAVFVEWVQELTALALLFHKIQVLLQLVQLTKQWIALKVSVQGVLITILLTTSTVRVSQHSGSGVSSATMSNGADVSITSLRKTFVTRVMFDIHHT